MIIKNFIKVLDCSLKNESAIKCRSWDKMNGFRYWNGSDKKIQNAKILNIDIESENGFIIHIDIDISKLRDKGSIN